MKVQQKPGPVVDALRFDNVNALPDGVVPNRRNIGTFLFRIQGENYARIEPGDYVILMPDGKRVRMTPRQFAETYEVLDEPKPVRKKRTKKRGTVAAMSQPGRMDEDTPAPVEPAKEDDE